MFDGFGKVLEVGCQEGFGAHLVSSGVDHLDCLDLLSSLHRELSANPKITFYAHDMLDGPMANAYDGIFALDVLEHIEKDAEHRFIENIWKASIKTEASLSGCPASSHKSMPRNLLKSDTSTARQDLNLSHYFLNTSIMFLASV
jgi:hypothetical protein